jgi:aryl-alcohol dehydrogenase-like predicted oxidoreductase
MKLALICALGSAAIAATITQIREHSGMRYRPLGRTGQYVSEICLGTMTFSGGAGFWRAIGALDQASSTALVGRAIEAGVNFFDTANVYSEGQSEIQLGQALRDLGVKREDVIIATKVRGRMGTGPNAVGLSRGHIMDEIAASLKRLGLDHVDLYQIHGFDPVTPLEETMRALDDCVRRGLVRTIGCSNLAAWQIMKALAISDKNGLARFETVQAYYSIAGRELEREILPLVEDQGLGVMVWSPLAGGFLSGKFARDKRGDNDSRRTVFDFPPVEKERAFDVIDVMATVAKAHDASVARVALAWLLQRKGVMSVIIGAKTLQQLDDNIAAASLNLASEEIAKLDAVSALKPEYPGWMLARQAEGRVPAPKA